MLDESELLPRNAEIRTATRRDAARSGALAALSTRLAEAISDVDDVLESIVRLISEWLGDTAESSFLLRGHRRHCCGSALEIQL